MYVDRSMVGMREVSSNFFPSTADGIPLWERHTSWEWFLRASLSSVNRKLGETYCLVAPLRPALLTGTVSPR